MVQKSMSTVTPSTFAFGGFDALRIYDSEFTVTRGANNHTFETPRDDLGRITFVNCGNRSRKIIYGERAFVGMAL